MRNLDHNILPEEQILFRTKKHLILFFAPICVLLLAIVFTYYMLGNELLIKVLWVPWAITLLIWAYYALEYLTSDFVVTNKRILMREGFFNRHTSELRLTAISQVNVNQGIVGQLLDYGNVSINAFGSFDSFSTIAHPLRFQKQVNEQLFKIAQ